MNKAVRLPRRNAWAEPVIYQDTSLNCAIRFHSLHSALCNGRRLVVREIHRPLYVKQLFKGQFRVTRSHGRVLDRSILVRKYLGDRVGRFRSNVFRIMSFNAEPF